MKTEELLAQVMKAGRFKSKEAAEEAALRSYLEHIRERNIARGGYFLLIEVDVDLVGEAKMRAPHRSRAEALQAALEHFLRVTGQQ
jgi:Arc/MetJ family transcription regulator